MKYTQDFSVDDFPFWSGAKDTVEAVRDAGKMDDLQSLVEEQFQDRIPTKTDVNDFVWFEREFIFAQLGIGDGGEEG